MVSDEQQELIDSFSELPSIGQELADRINSWNERNLEDDKGIPLEKFSPEVSGDSVVFYYTENGTPGETVYTLLKDIGFSIQEESDDTISIEGIENKDVDERMNNFLGDCITISNSYPFFVKAIHFQSGSSSHKAEVRIVIPSESDFRKLPSIDARKIMFMHFLKEVREHAARYSMLDESMCFCKQKQEFLFILRPISACKQEHLA